MTMFVEDEGLAVLLMEHLPVEKAGRFYELERLRITVERMEYGFWVHAL